jgi:hypothetical protein
MIMIAILAAALAAAQPAALPAQAPASGHQHAQAGTMPMGEHGHMGSMSAECAKCCEEMMAKMHEGPNSAPSEHKH